MAGLLSRLVSGASSVVPWGRLAAKADVPAPVEARSFAPLYSLFLNPQEITPYQAWLLYKSVSTLAKVVNLIADQAAGLVPMVKVDGEVMDGHPVVTFLNRPGFNRTRRRLIKELAVQYLVTGTAYPSVIGNPDMLPVAMDVIKSRAVSVMPGADMWPDTYNYSEGTRSALFQRIDDRDPRWVDGLSGLAELVPIYDMDGDQRGVGLSRLNAIRLDVELRYKGIMHNAAVLDNGARLSGVLSYKDLLNEEQRDDIRELLKSRTTGSNACGVLVTDGGQADFTPLSMNAKDMDFANLVKLVENSIIANYNVPITLFNVDAQTNNNYETAWYMFYDNAVLPTFEIIYSGLAQMFSRRLGHEIEIVHDALTNAVLAKQASARARELFGANLISRNEARNIAGYEPVLGGDTIYGPLGEQPVGEDLFNGIDDNPMNADGYKQHRRDRNPEIVPPAPAEQEPAGGPGGGKPTASTQSADDKPAKLREPKDAKGRIALVYDAGARVPRPVRVKKAA